MYGISLDDQCQMAVAVIYLNHVVENGAYYRQEVFCVALLFTLYYLQQSEKGAAGGCVKDHPEIYPFFRAFHELSMTLP